MREVVLRPTVLSRGALAVARDLLGTMLVSRVEGRCTAGIILETEAYCGALDGACHAFRYHRSERNASMYTKPGTAYVYLIYGIHHCLNVSCLTREEPHAVLIRGLYPVIGTDTMISRRGLARTADGRLPSNLVDGPGKLCQALGIDRSLDGSSLTDPSAPVFLAEGPGIVAWESTARIGLGGRGAFASLPWRFVARQTGDDILPSFW